MRIATFNCNSIRVRLPAILAWLDKYRPDILALQETKVTDKDFPLAPIEDRGWHAAFHGEKSYNGVAILSPLPLKNISFGMRGDSGSSDTRLLRAVSGEVTIVNTYVPQGQDLESDRFRFKLDWLARLADYFKANFDPGRERVAWIGDMNVAPEAMDVYDSKAVWPHVCHCQDVADAFRAVVAVGFRDVFRKHLPDPETFTFWDYRRRNSLELNRGWRIDHILATPPLADRSCGCHVDIGPRRADRPSDHTFVYADFSPQSEPTA
ncbi:MAG: exodeoxyribonuclease III [Planctomycetota bacterium]|jgi:exodeoxyribonuclease-3|nr:exodeoxyribonuclease III [Planctomycetota bacterium]